MTVSIIEREARLLVQRPAVLSAVARLRTLGEFRVVSRRRERQRNTYLDTPAYQLRRRGAILKLRTVGRRVEVTFKQSRGYRRGVASRLEMTSRIRPSQMARLSRGELNLKPMRRARALIGRRALRPVVTLFTDRRVLMLAHGKHRVELDLDRVTFRKGGRIVARRDEVEVENVTASASVFRQAIAALRKQFRRDVRLSHVSKYAYGLRVAKAATHP